jgi:hypothetical protein
MLVRRRHRHRRGKLADKSDESTGAAAELTYASGPGPSSLRTPVPVSLKGSGAAAAVVAGDSRGAPAQQPSTVAPERRPRKEASVVLSRSGQRTLGSASPLPGMRRDPMPSASVTNTSLELPAGGTFNAEAHSAAEAIATEELLRELDARGVLATAQEPPPMYEEASR